jgi:hypothetical protein
MVKAIEALEAKKPMTVLARKREKVLSIITQYPGMTTTDRVECSPGGLPSGVSFTGPMGYSIATPIRSDALHTKMLAFLDREWQPFPVLAGRPRNSPTYIRGPLSGDLSYDQGKRHIGFDYGPVSDYERGYAFATCHRMALRVGQRKRFEGLVPYYVYDRYEDTPVLIESEWPKSVKKKYSVSDEYGLRLHKNLDILTFRAVNVDALDLSEVLRTEFKRLDAAWTLEMQKKR